jgi:hypothetical protein
MGELGALAAISPASGSRPATAEPPALLLVPAQQGTEAVLSSLPPLCASSAQGRHKLLVVWLRDEGAAGLVHYRVPISDPSISAAIFNRNF